MSITRANAETLLVRRIGPLLVAAGMDGATVDGTNNDLNGPIGWAVRYLGHTTADITSITDTDMAKVAAADYDEFLDIATLQALESIIGNLDDVDIAVGPRSEKLSQLAKQAEGLMDRLLKRRPGYGMTTPEIGYITHNIAEHD